MRRDEAPRSRDRMVCGVATHPHDRSPITDRLPGARGGLADHDPPQPGRERVQRAGESLRRLADREHPHPIESTAQRSATGSETDHQRTSLDREALRDELGGIDRLERSVEDRTRVSTERRARRDLERARVVAARSPRHSTPLTMANCIAHEAPLIVSATMPEDEFTWDDPARSYASTWRRVLGAPREFFAAVPVAQGLQAPIGFLLVSLAIGGVGLVLFGWGWSALPRLVIGGFLRTILGAIVYWAVATRVFGGKGDYESTLRVLAYASAVTVFLFIPRIRILAALYGAFLVIVGLEQAHHFDATRSVLTVILSWVVALAVIYTLGIHHWIHPMHPAWAGQGPWMRHRWMWP